MAKYVKTNWTNRAVQYPSRYAKSAETTTSVVLVADPGTVTDSGTPVNSTNMNNIESGLENIYIMYWMGGI